MPVNNSERRKRGRPRKARPLRRLADTITQFHERTGISRAKIWRDMAAGKLKFVQPTPGGVRRIPYSEYARLGFDLPAD
jgi:hypothetical protein